MQNILKRLGFGIKGDKVSIPLFRAADISREIDLIEEKIKNIDKYDETSKKQSYSENDIIISNNLSESLDELEFIEISNENLDNDGEIIFTEVPTNSELNEL